MKEEYFTSETIDAEARQFLSGLDHFRQRRQLTVHHEHIALLVLDMQRYFLETDSHAFVPSALAIIPNIIQLQNRCLEQGIPVIQTMHLNTPADSRSMGRWWRELIEPESIYSKVTCDLADSRVLTIEKTQYDAFLDTSLEQELQNAGVTQLIITGVMTHLCCETTARTAFMKGYDVFFTVDGTATYNREFHQASLLNLAHGFAVPVLTEEIAVRLGL